ncbi:ABC transporter substrate-binding protein [Neobacillus sp. 114]|uniref:ABC transporter substrate-binding protein n=1 Tax=Neobacillus sp. 114 TaxID=3048535 RepID=UPI001C2134C7|nr:ABC transporter substrate-binding protein [Neobacillus sp. 114]MBU8918985.1 ABC transporter substrate-binding protein [Bacillus sp. FJAT-29953]
MKGKRLSRWWLLVVASLILALTACSSGSNSNSSSSTKEEKTESASAGKPQDGGTLKVGLSANPKTMDPIKYTGVYESQVMRSVADTLIVYNKDLSDFLPALATEWKVSDDMKVYTFKLRDDVYFQPGKFQDGRKMTAEDVKYSLERSAKQSAMNRLRGVDKVEVTGENEVAIYLTEPNAALMPMLTDAGNVIVPKEEVEGWGDQFGSHLVGTGPFKIESWDQDSQIKVVRHDKYWGEKPHLDSVVFKIIPDPNMMVNSLRSGDIDVGMDVKGQNRELVKQDSKLELLSKPALSLTYLDLNNKKGPTADKKVREAIYKATNIDEIVKGVNKWGGAEKSFMALPKGSWGYSKDLEKLTPTYDPKEAKKLLAEAGYPDGFKTELYLAESRVPYGTIFQNQMKKNLNIDVELKVVEWGTYSDTVAKGNAPMSIGGWTWYPDPYFFLFQLFHTKQIGALGNGKGYENPEVDKLLDRAVTETVDQKERAKLYQQALEIILKDVPRIELDTVDASAGIAKSVQGFDVSPDYSLQIVNPNGTNVWLKK